MPWQIDSAATANDVGFPHFQQFRCADCKQLWLADELIWRDVPPDDPGGRWFSVIPTCPACCSRLVSPVLFWSGLLEIDCEYAEDSDEMEGSSSRS